MNVPINWVIAVIVVFGFLTGSSLYFYNSNRTDDTAKEVTSQEFTGEIPSPTGSEQAKVVDELTQPAAPRGRVTYPANVYTLGNGETLFGIGAKFDIDWRLIVLANGLENENVVQAGKQLAIPKLSHETDYYRLHFILDEDKASEINREARSESNSQLFNPIEVAKESAVPYFGIAAGQEFTLLEQDNSQGTALVQAKSGELVNVVGLFQPKQKGDNGFWAVLYVEHHGQ